MGLTNITREEKAAPTISIRSIARIMRHYAVQVVTIIRHYAA